MRLVFAFFFLVFVCLLTIGQDFNNYVPLISKGNIPIDFLGENTNNWDSINFENNNVKPSLLELKKKEEFRKVSDFQIKYVLQSGDLLISDLLSEYAGKIADILLVDYPKIRNSIHFFTARYPDVNAFCIYNGIILINIGLFAQLENEAQLAFIIAHELVHFVNQHAYDAYTNSVFSESKKYKNNSYSEQNKRLFATMQYSKELELEADEQGFLKFFRNSGYKLSEAESVCDVLLYSDFPVDEIEFTHDNIESSNFILPDECWLETISPISAVEDYDDTKLSHPNIKKRREKLKTFIDDAGNQGSEFIIGKDEFLRMRNIARFELCNLLLQDKKFIDVIYLVNVLKKDFPESNYLNIIQARAYYGLILACNKGSFGSQMSDWSKKKGESQRLFNIFRILKRANIYPLAVREIWKARQLNPTDPSLNKMAELSVRYMFLNGDFESNYFLFNNKSDSVEIEVLDTSAIESKYDKINSDQKKVVVATDPFQYAFVDFKDDSAFVNLFNRTKNIKDKSSAASRWNVLNPKRTVEIDNLIILDPWYFDIAVKNRTVQVNYSEENREISLLTAVEEMSVKNKVNIHVLDFNKFSTDSIQAYNDYQLLKRVLSTFGSRWDSRIDSSEYIGFEQERVDSLIAKYSTIYVARCGIIQSNAMLPMEFYIPVLLSPPSIPIALFHMLFPKHRSMYFFEVYNLKSGEVVFSDTHYLSMRTTPLMMKSFLYDSFNKLHK